MIKEMRLLLLLVIIIITIQITTISLFLQLIYKPHRKQSKTFRAEMVLKISKENKGDL